MKLEPSDFEAHADEGDEAHGMEIEEETRASENAMSQDEEMNKEDLIDELKKLDMGDQEETAYTDINYWKSAVQVDVDNLLSELGQ